MQRETEVNINLNKKGEKKGVRERGGGWCENERSKGFGKVKFSKLETEGKIEAGYFVGMERR